MNCAALPGPVPSFAVNFCEAPRIERREAPRFPVTLPVTFEGGQGWTRDVSVSGVFFTTEWPFPIGAPIQFTLVLENVAPGARQQVSCQGTVVRVERSEQAYGVAVSLDGYEIGNAELGPPGPTFNAI